MPMITTPKCHQGHLVLGSVAPADRAHGPLGRHGTSQHFPMEQQVSIVPRSLLGAAAVSSLETAAIDERDSVHFVASHSSGL